MTATPQPPSGIPSYVALVDALATRAKTESLRRISRATGIDASCLSRFLRGQRDMMFFDACRLADYLGLRLVAVANAKEELTP